MFAVMGLRLAMMCVVKRRWLEWARRAGWTLIAVGVLLLGCWVIWRAFDARTPEEFDRWVGWANVLALPVGGLGTALVLLDKAYRRPPPVPTEQPDQQVEAQRAAYLQQVCASYGQVDAAILLPLTERDNHPDIQLREVFVAQAVRADPPPVELPREFWRRLAEAGELDDDDLPKELDRDTITRARQAYQDRPTRPVLQVLTEPAGRRLVILGDPGAGKSTLARYLALTLAAGRPEASLASLAGWLPLIVELRMYAEDRWRSGTFLDFIDFQHTSTGLGLPKPHLESLLNTNDQALVIFDGLDELFDPRLRENVTQQIAAFANRYPKARIVVTSRVIGYRRQTLDAAGFSHHMLQDLDRTQIEAFAHRWYHIACPTSPGEATRLQARLLAAIDASRAVRELAGNPMLLTILTIIGRRRELPRDRKSVYDHAVTVLVEHWDADFHNLTTVDLHPELPHLDRDDKLELLRLVARRMQNAPAGLAGNHIPGPDLLDEFTQYLQTRFQVSEGVSHCAARAMLDQFRERNFILSRFGAEVYGFVHRAFLEYLAADDIVNRLNRRELSETQLIEDVFARHWADPAWHEVLLLITGMADWFAGQIIVFLLAADPLWAFRPEPLPRHALLAIRCLGEVRKLGDLTRQSRAVVDTITRLLETANEQERYGGTSPLTPALTQAVLPVFAALGPTWSAGRRYLHWYRLRGQLLPDPAYGGGAEAAVSVATQAAALLQPANATFHKWLIAQTIFRPQWTMRRAAVQAIAAGWADDPGTLPLLRERATTDDNGDVRWAAVQAIAGGFADDPGTLALLRERATTDDNGDVRRAAVQAIAAGWADDPGTLALLRERATTDDRGAVRQAAVQAIAAGWADDPGTLALLRERATTDDDNDVRQAAVQAIAAGWADDPGTLALLRERATTDDHWAVRQAAVQAIAAGWADDPGTLPWLRDRATTDDDNDVRQAAVQAIAAGWADDPGTLPWLRDRATTDDNGDVRQAAVQAIAAGWADDPGTLPLLRERATTDDNNDVRRAAVQAIAAGWADDPGTLPLLRERATTDDHWAVRQAAVQAIAAGWADDPGTLPWLRDRATTDNHWAVRQAAVQAIAAGWADDPGTLPLLRDRATTDNDNDVRQAAVQAIAAGWADDPGTLPWLRDRATTDNNEAVRHAAVQAIAAGWADDPGTLPLLRDRATTDDNNDVRRAAVQAIAAGWADDPGTLPLLRERATTDDNGDVRQAAVQAIAAGWADDPGTLPLLRERATTDNHWAVRQAAVQAIAAGWADDPGTLPWLRDRATTDNDNDVRRAAVQAIAAGWADDPGTLPLLRDRATTDNNGDVRQAAVQAIARIEKIRSP